MRNKQFVFITGSPGSGSNMIARIMSRVTDVLGIGETHQNFDHFMLDKFNEAQAIAWDRHADFKDHIRHKDRVKDILEQISLLPQVHTVTHVVFRRSILSGDGYRLVLSDIRDLYPESKIILMYRNPIAATSSAFRRKLGKNLRHCAILQEEFLTIINSQIRLISPDDLLILDYDHFCSNPLDGINKLSEFTSLPFDKLKESCDLENIDSSRTSAWNEELSSEDASRLWEFFTPRTVQWVDLLTRSHS